MPGVSESRTYDALLTTTLANYRGKLYDNIFDDYPLLSWLNGKLGKALRGESVKRMVDSGESIVEHVLYEQNSTVQSYSGYEQFTVVPQEGMTIARYSWRQYAGTVTISGLEKRTNRGEAKMIDLLKSKITQLEESMRDRMSRDAWGTNSDGKSFDGVPLIVDSTGTVGGLSASTYTWWAATETGSGSFASQGLSDMTTMFNTLSKGNNTPDAIFMPQAVFEYFDKTFQTLTRYMDVKSANAGFETLTFKGKPVIFDRDCTAGTIYFLNSRAINLCVHPDADLELGKMLEPENQDAWSAKCLFQGNITTPERRRHGKLTSVTA